MATGNVSAQNNVTTAAEYQAAADEITAIINAQRADRAPIEAEQTLLQNRAELLFERQQQALNTLRAAEADPGDTAFLEQSRLAYNRATSEVNTVNTAIQQNRSVLAQSRQSTAELQDQRSTLEVLAEFAEQGPPNQNSLPPPATTVPDQTATFVPTPPGPIPPTVTPASQPAAATPTATTSAQNNVTTAAEYQAAADEITAIINTQRAERAPIEAEQELLRNRQEILIARQQTALNTLRAAEADPGDTAFLEASRTAYVSVTNEVNATNLAIQQNRSVLAQSRLSTAELQEQRGRLETNADLAAQGVPPLNSLPPPATVVPDQAATTVATPPPAIVPVFAATTADGTAGEAEAQAALQTQAPAQNNVSTAEDWEETTFEISTAQRTIRAENFAAAENLANLNQQLTQASQARQLARDNLDRAVAAGASDAEIAALDAQRQTALDTAVQLEQQIEREQSVIAGNQETLNLLEQQRFIADEAALAARSGPPGLNSVPPPATVIPDQDPAAYDLPAITYADSFQAAPVSADGDEALQALEDAEAAGLAAQEGVAFAEPVTLDDPEARAIQDALDADLAAQEGLAFPPIASPAPVAGDEALQAIEDAEAADLARQEGVAFAEPLDVPASGDEALQAIEDAELAAQEGGAFAESPLPVSGDDALAATNEAELAAIRDAEGRAVFGPAPVDGDPAFGAATDAEAAAINQALADDAEIAGAAALQAGREQQLRDQFTIQQRYNTSTQGDWRVRIRLAPGANYLYKAPAGQRGILEPLVASDGVIFPYTPTIQTSYTAKYDSYNLTHSNYRGYFYQSSQVGDISINGIFTAQDTTEAQYLLAVIHFFRSVTKMFYGKDQFRGAPPPSVELSGFGEYQFNNHPCLVASFNYSLPKDVDYIQITPNNQGLNLGNRPSKVSSSPSSTLESVARRLSNAGLPRGGQTSPTDLGVVTNTVNGTTQTTYVPTKVEIAITLHPLQTRQQVSQAFSLENFANGNLLKGGFW